MSSGIKRNYDFLRLAFCRLSKETAFFHSNCVLTGYIIWWGPILTQYPRQNQDMHNKQGHRRVNVSQSICSFCINWLSWKKHNLRNTQILHLTEDPNHEFAQGYALGCRSFLRLLWKNNKNCREFGVKQHYMKKTPLLRVCYFCRETKGWRFDVKGLVS